MVLIDADGVTSVPHTKNTHFEMDILVPTGALVRKLHTHTHTHMPSLTTECSHTHDMSRDHLWSH